MSYSGYKSSSRGSRGFRGGYRGSSRGGGDSWRGSGGRGYTSSSRGSGRGSRFSGGGGGGKWVRDTSSGSYDSRSRYNSGGERYSSHSRDENSYRYRGDDSISSYTSRDHAHRASSPDRKRMRVDYSPASSMHRSHDYGDGIDSSYSSRSYGGYENKRMSGSYGDDRRTSLFREERERIRSDDYEFRKPLSVGGPRHSTPRGSSYRGRSYSRGLRGSSGFRRPYRGGGGFVRKRTLGEGFGIRRRIATGKSQEYLRRLKLYRLQRLRRLRDRAEREGSDDDDEDDEEDEDDLEGEEEEVEEEIEEEVTDDETKDVDVKEEEDDKEKKDNDNEDEEMEEGGDEEKKDKLTKKKKVKKVVKVIKKVKRSKVPKKESVQDKDENDENKEIHVTVKQDSEGRDVDASSRKNFHGEPFMKLDCPHCSATCETFLEYKKHLYSSKHQAAMMEVAVKVRKRLARLRLDQRNEQRELDEECKVKNMKMRTFYCMTCKLNYRSLKSEHLNSDRHNEMKKLLYPVCRACRLSCKSPMMYENHTCSLEHLKRKHYFDKKTAERQEGNEIDMDKYMVLDQVGSGEEESESESSEKGEEKEENDESKGDDEGEKEEKEKKTKKKKKVVNLGSEYCKKIEVYFCDLCKTFLPRIEDQEQALSVHCRGRNHLHWYVKKRDDIALRKRAERIHRMREEQRKAEIKEEGKEVEPMEVDDTEAKSSDAKKGSSATNANEEVDVEAGMDEKTWSEVDKDLGDLLNQVEEQETEPGNKSSDDEEDSRAAGRRYDRFKHSEKGKQKEEDKGKSEEKGVKVEAVNGDDKDDA